MFDMKNLTRLKKLNQNLPAAMKAWAFDTMAFVDDARTGQHKKLIAGRTDHAMPILHQPSHQGGS